MGRLVEAPSFLYHHDAKSGKVFGKNRLNPEAEIKHPELNPRISAKIYEAMGFKEGVRYIAIPHPNPVMDTARFPDITEFQFQDLETGDVVPNARLLQTKQYRLFVNPEMEIEVIEGIPMHASIKGALEELPALQMASTAIHMLTKDGKEVPRDLKVLVNLYGIVGGDGPETTQAQSTGRKMDNEHGRLLAQAHAKFLSFIFSTEKVAYGSDNKVDATIFFLTKVLSLGGYYVAYILNETPERTLERLDAAFKKNKR